MEQKFCISHVKISVFSEPPLHVHGKWQRFASVHERPDILYRIHRCTALPEVYGKEEYRDGRVCSYGEKGKTFRQYLTPAGEPYCFVAESTADAWDLYVRECDFPWGSDVSHFFELFDLTHALLSYGVLLFHCAYILTPKGAILFTAPSGTGKSTQAELWKRHRGAQIINGDRAAIRVENGKAMACGVPFSGSSDCCENMTAPILAIVGLSQAKENDIHRLTGSVAVQELLHGVYRLPEHRDDTPQIVDLAIEISKCVPVYHLSCLPDEGAVVALERELEILY